ncbi:MAG: hypothetical protein QGI83_13885, partial [Candidatus Latescibacteria bacterium]|nr:hypothetical protein [Candidatus Latescibacterota bacterium]
MTAIHNILGVARYERKMLIRTPRFRILGGIGIAIPFIVGIFLAILESRGVEFDSALGMGAFIPFSVYSYLQTLVIAFIVGDFRAADERAHVYEVIAGCPISTAELVIGKYLGVVGGLVTLSLGVLALTVAVQAAKISIMGTPFTIEPYITYLLVMTLPALVYMSALTFFLGAVLRRQTAVTLVAIAYALAVLFFLGKRYGGVYDFGAFFAPLFYSDMMGLGDISRVIDQRLFYLALALCFFGLSIDRYPRLSQSRGWTWFGRGLAAVGLILAGGLYLHVDRQELAKEAYRKTLLQEQRRYADTPAVQVLHYAFDLQFTAKGAPLEARAELKIRNPHEAPLDTLVFTLNPGLELRSVLDGQGRKMTWTRGHAVISILAGDLLSRDSVAIVTFVYDGDIDRQGIYLMRDRARLRKGRWPFIKGDLTAWIRDDSAFLPPRSRWYPNPGVDYGHDGAPPLSFATADIAISVPEGLEAITQGKPAGTDSLGSRVRFNWKVEHPVSQFSLNVGEYERFEAQIHGIDCALYIHPAHRRQVLFFEEAKEQVLEVLGQALEAIEQELGLAYPYPRLSVVEVPFLVQWYYEGWEETGGLTQPGVLMVEEDVLMGLRFTRDFERRKRWSRGNTSPEQIKRDLLAGAIFRTFLSKESGRAGLYRSPVLQLWSFDRSFEGDQSALLKRGLPLYMQEDLSSNLMSTFFSRGMGRGRMRGMRGRFRRPQSSGARWDTLLARMEDRSFAELDPVAEAGLYRSVLDAKGLTLFRMMEAVVGDEEFVSVLESFAEDRRYQAVSFTDFEKAVAPDSLQAEGQMDLQRLIHDWIYGTDVPGYTLTRATAKKIDDGWGMVVYQVVVRVRNGEPGRGFVQIRVTGREDEAVKAVQIEGGQEVEVALMLWERPFRVMVEPFFARNQRPLISPLSIPDEVVLGTPESYVRIVTEEESRFTEVIVDNDDPGFSMPVLRVQRFLRPGLKGANWRVREMPMAFGRYEANFRYKQPGDGAQPAVWETRLPHSGEYDVAYYYIMPRFGRRMGLAKSFTLTVTHEAEVDTLTLEHDQLKGGWNLLGRFDFEADEAVKVVLSDVADGRLYADAVRWRFVDPDRPTDVYAEDLP